MVELCRGFSNVLFEETFALIPSLNRCRHQNSLENFAPQIFFRCNFQRMSLGFASCSYR